MKVKNLNSYLAIVTLALICFSCSSTSTPEPAAPANSKAVQDFVKGKKLAVKKVGFYDKLSINKVQQIKWLDIATEKDNTMKSAAEDEMQFMLQFVNDTSVNIVKKGKTYTGTYTIDNKKSDNSEDKPGINLKITYADPEFSFGDTPTDVTYTYPVLGVDVKRIMLETPRSINDQKMISILE